MSKEGFPEEIFSSEPEGEENDQQELNPEAKKTREWMLKVGPGLEASIEQTKLEQIFRMGWSIVNKEDVVATKKAFNGKWGEFSDGDRYAVLDVAIPTLIKISEATDDEKRISIIRDCMRDQDCIVDFALAKKIFNDIQAPRNVTDTAYTVFEAMAILAGEEEKKKARQHLGIGRSDEEIKEAAEWLSKKNIT